LYVTEQNCNNYLVLILYNWSFKFDFNFLAQNFLGLCNVSVNTSDKFLYRFRLLRHSNTFIILYFQHDVVIYTSVGISDIIAEEFCYVTWYSYCITRPRYKPTTSQKIW
jgi:hypothetical protein